MQDDSLTRLDTAETVAETRAGTVAPLCEHGTGIGRYIVQQILGQGGMGVVYRAHDPELDRAIAIKVLRPDKAKNPDAAEARLRREARLMAKISHPNVLPVYDVGQYEGRIFVAMQYVEGPTLGDWVRKARPAWDEIVEAYVEAGRGLAAAHALGLVHRDFKPHNVLLAAGGRPQVMDFGLARTASMATEATCWSLSESSEDDSDEETVASLTETGRVVGTPRYMSPEQHQGPDVDARSDQYCFCAALYESLYGLKPFGGGGLKRIGRRKVRGQLQPPPRDTKVPGRIQEILERGLDPKPEARWADLGELLDALESPPKPPSLLARVLLPIAGLTLAAGVFAMPQIDGGSMQDATAVATTDASTDSASHRAWPELDLARRELSQGQPRRARAIAQVAFTESLAADAHDVSIESANLMAEIETALGHEDEALHWARTARALGRAAHDDRS